MLTIHLSSSSLLLQFSLSPPLDRWRARKKTFLVVSTEVYIVALSLEVAFSAGVTTFPTGPHRPTQKYSPDSFPILSDAAGSSGGLMRGLPWDLFDSNLLLPILQDVSFHLYYYYYDLCSGGGAKNKCSSFSLGVGGCTEKFICLFIKDIFGQCVFLSIVLKNVFF